MKRVLKRILLTGWGLVAAVVLSLVFYPSVLVHIPHLELVRPLLIVLMLASIAYGVVALYSSGMKRGNR